MRAVASLLLLAGLALPAFGQTDVPGDEQLRPLAREGLFPESGMTDVDPDTQLMVITAKPISVAQAGTITVYDAADDHVVASFDLAHRFAVEAIGGIPGFNYVTVTSQDREVTLHPPNGALRYGKTYYVTFQTRLFHDGELTVEGTTDKNSWWFSTRAAPPAKDKDTYVIASDGTGDFCTFQGAIDSLPEGNTRPRTFDIKPGYYEEIVAFANKHSLTFRGEDREHTILAYANNDRFNGSGGNPYASGTSPSSVVHVKGRIYHRGVFLAHRCDNLVLTNLTVENTTPHGGSQAEAVILNGTLEAKALLIGVNLYSYQDTLQINGQAYLQDCYVQGDVDFLWGTGPCFFDHCRFHCVSSGGYYTQIRNPATNHGYVFLRCTFDGSESINRTYLSRIEPDRFPSSEVVLIHCNLGTSVIPVGWLLQKAKGSTEEPKAPETLHFWEIDSKDLVGKPADLSSRMEGSRHLDASTDADIIDQYSLPAYVLGGWDPRKDPIVPKQ